MKAKELIEEAIKNLEPVTEPEMLEVVKHTYYKNEEQLQEFLDKYYPPEELLEEKAEEYADSIEPGASEASKQRLIDAFKENYYGRKTFAERFKVNEELLSGTYAVAFTKYNHGMYAEARNFFNLLVLMDEYNPDYRFGMAATLHMLHEYDEAIPHYNVCTVLDLDNPIPWFHLADCYMQLEKWDLAMFALRSVVHRVKNKELFKEIQNKSEVLIEVVAHKLLASDKEKDASQTVS
jgi:type III secretion system low calcium response chaperone LcrH/SycD